MALVGMPVDDPNVQAALNFIENNWTLGEHLQSSIQRAYCLMKGLEAYGITDEITVGVSGDWFDELSTYIVSIQNFDGSWPSDYHDWEDPYPMTAAWALLTLEKAVAIPMIAVSIDIKPGSWPNPINKGSNGVFSVAICGTDEFDVMTIDPGTVMIHVEGVDEGVYPLRWSYEDAAKPYTGDPGGGHEFEGDGYLDIVFHFGTQDVVLGLELCIYDDETIPLIIRGHLLDEEGGTALEGQDYVWLKTPIGLGKGQNYPPPFLKGNRISVNSDDFVIPVDEYSFVGHGWSMDSWKDLSKEEQNTFKEEYWFKLYIDNVPVELKEWKKHYKTLGDEQDVMLLLFYIQFKPNSFGPGIHTFSGEWYHGSTLLQALEVVVTFIQ